MQIKHQISELGGLSKQERKLVADLRRQGLSIVDNRAVIEKLKITRSAANQILLRLEKKGWLQRVERGRYIFVDLTATNPTPIVEDALVLAMDLFSPCYLTGWTAAEHWGLTEQIFNSILVYSATYQRISENNIGGVNFVLRRVQDSDIFGTKVIWSSNHKIVIADMHRTIIDILNRPEDGGSAIQTFEICREYFQSSEADTNKLLLYADKIGNGTVFKRLGFIGEQLLPTAVEFIETCQKNISKGVSLFDPSGPKKGRIYSKWNLKINIALGDT